MDTFSNFVFYQDVFLGDLTEAEYKKSVNEACAEIISQTTGAAKTAPVVMGEAIQLCECALADLISTYKQTAALIPPGVTSINNDSFSITANAGNGNTLAKQEVKEKKEICVRHLQYPVNLMCRWI